MALHLPLTLKLTRAALARHDAFCALIARTVAPRRADAAEVFHAFAFKADEDDFARALLERHTQLWLYRANQRASCGDFVIVDMASPWPARRTAYVVELKLGMTPRIGGGAVGLQLQHAAQATADLPCRGPGAPVITVAGDGATLAARFPALAREAAC
jgi:hypothetical protein